MTNSIPPMSPSHGSGWQALEPKKLEDLDGDMWEKFCADLVGFEAYDRHDSPSVHKASGAAGKRDGGRDVLVEVSLAPLVSKRDYQRQFHVKPLTEDGANVAYSCKAGANWLSLAIDKDIVQRKEPGRSVEVLSAGGFFKLLINQVGNLDIEILRGRTAGKSKKNVGASPGKKARPLRHLADAFWEKLKKLDPEAPDPIARIEIVDVSSIVDYLKGRNPVGGAMAEWLEKLSLQRLLHGVEYWEKLHIRDREKPDLVADPARDEMLKRVRGFFSGHTPDRSAWLVGPPGIGKTRLVLEALSSVQSANQRALIALNHEEAMAAIGNGLLQRHPNCILIVDDCPAIEASHTANRFLTATNSNEACVLVITPGHVAHSQSNPFNLYWELDRLSDASIQRLVESTLSRAVRSGEEHDKVVSQIVALSQGYPWFAYLLARASNDEQRAPTNAREAAMWALVGKHEAKGVERDQMQVRRGRALVAASLSTRHDWPSMSDEDRKDLLASVQIESWGGLQVAAQECVQRGILRQSANWKFKYVTPLVLEREIILWFFGDGGPDPNGGTLIRYAKRFLPAFYENLARLDLSPELLSRFASLTLDELRAARFDWDKARQGALLGARLSFAATQLPAQMANELRTWVEATTLEELKRRDGERRSLVFALESMAARQASFEDAEAALFRLAMAENESYANNATAVWASLFSIALNITYRPILDRFELLSKRLRDPEGDVRLVALSGLLRVLATREMRIAIDPLDGPRHETSSIEAAQARQLALTLLASMIADVDVRVARAAKKWLVGSLRSGVRRHEGRPLSEMIRTGLAAFEEDELIHTRKVLEEIRVYDHPSPDDAVALAKLEEALSPRTFQERLRQALSGWSPVLDAEGQKNADCALADEMLRHHADQLEQHLSWMLGTPPARFGWFAFGLGRADVGLTLLPALKEKARKSIELSLERRFFVAYVTGVADRVGRGEASNIFQKVLDEGDVESFALSLPELGATQKSFNQLTDLVRRRKVGLSTLRELAHRSGWLGEIESEQLNGFLHELYNRDPGEYCPILLPLLLGYRSSKPEEADGLDPWLLKALAGVELTPSHSTETYYWETTAMLLLSRPHFAEPVTRLIVNALLTTEGMRQEPWVVFREALRQNPGVAWRELSAVLEHPGSGTDGLLLSFRFQQDSFEWPKDEVLRWVGKNSKRGQIAVDLVRPYSASLDPVLRELLHRFGGRSAIAQQIAARIHSTGKVVASLSQHDAEQLEFARNWLDDKDPEVRRFASDLVASLTQSHESHLAAEQDTQRRSGTR